VGRSTPASSSCFSRSSMDTLASVMVRFRSSFSLRSSSRGDAPSRSEAFTVLPLRRLVPAQAIHISSLACKAPVNTLDRGVGSCCAAVVEDCG
jgi:hypothetical protein